MCVDKKRVADSVRKLVEENKLTEALDHLCSVFDHEDYHFRNEVSLLKRQVFEVGSARRTGILDYEEASKVKNKIGLAILELTCLVCSYEEYK